MVRIRLQRLGRTHRPFFRIAAVDVRNRRDGKIIENLGWLNPVERDVAKQMELKSERITHWLAQGAQPSETMMDILGKAELLPEKMKAAWLEARETDSRRLAVRGIAKQCEAAVEELDKADAPEGFDKDAAVADAKKQRTAAREAISTGNVKAATAALEAIQALQAKLASAKPAPAAEGEAAQA